MFGRKASDIFNVGDSAKTTREKRKRESRKLPKEMQNLLGRASIAYIQGKYTDAISDLKQVCAVVEFLSTRVS